MTKQQPDYWQGCYDLGWQNLISPASFSHPAKFSRGLIFRIIEHALEDGLIQPGQTILDPFGGVALGALPALQNGLNWIGVELESKFVELGRQNIALWNSRFSGMPRWTGQAQLLQGDSRRLAEVVSAAGIVVSSPPYADTFTGQKDNNGNRASKISGNVSGQNSQIHHPRDYGSTPGQLATLPPGDIQTVISSPSFAGNTGGRGEASRNPSTGSGRSVIDAALFDRHSGGMKKGTGSDPANLDHLKMGTPPIAIVSSPPYAGAHITNITTGRIGDNPESPWKQTNGDEYGSTDGQLGAMKAGEVSAVVGSPPYGLTEVATSGNEPFGKNKGITIDEQRVSLRYGSSSDQLGNATGDTFWASARLIVEQCALLLPPGGAAIWVVKNYVKGGVEVQFSEQWQALCEACGFETVHEHRAMLVKENGAQGDMFGADKKNKVERKSFFRRLAEAAKKADAHWETLSNEDRAALIAAAYARLFEDYLAKLKETRKGKPAAITKSRLMREAKSRAWLRDGRLDYEIKTSIDWETVLCMKKPA